MNEENLYRQWIAGRKRQPIPEGFPRRVMEALPSEEKGPRPVFRYSLPVVNPAPFRWAAAIFLVLAGLVRLSYVTACLLLP